MMITLLKNKDTRLKCKLVTALAFSILSRNGFCEEINLICTGDIEVTTSSGVKGIKTHKNFEFTFDEKNKSLAYQGISFCFDRVADSDTLSISKKEVHYTCAGNPNLDGGIKNHNATVRLSRYSGLMKYHAIGIADNFTSYTDAEFKCSKTKQQF